VKICIFKIKIKAEHIKQLDASVIFKKKDHLSFGCVLLSL